jgi:phage-related protein
MASEPIDEAYVEIKPDLSDFDRDVNRELNHSFDKIEGKLDDLTDTIERQFDRLIDALDVNFSNLEHIANDTFDEIRDFARGTGNSIARDIEIGTKVAKHEIDDLADNAHHDFNRIERDARGSGFSIAGMFTSIGKSIGNLISDGLESVSSIGSKIGSSLGSTIGQVGSSIGTVTSGIGGAAQIAMYGVLVPLALGLAGALSQLAGALAALPAAAGVAVAAILPLVLAFHGFTDAIGAVLAGDPEKLNEALKKLSPSAASVVKEFQKFVKPFSEIQRLAQESLFKPLVGTLTQLANVVLPALRIGVPIVAGAFGNLFTQIASVFTNTGTTSALNTLFAATGRIIDNLTPSIVYLVEVINNLFTTGLPFVERFFGVIAKGIDSFAEWLGKAEDGGKVTDWLEKAWHVGTLVWEIFKSLAQYVGTLLGSFADEGTDSLEGINDALKKMNDYLKTSEGQETLHNLGVIVHWAGNAFVFFLGTLTTAWKGLNAFFDFVRGIGPFFTSIGAWFANLWNGIAGFFSNIGSSVSGWFTNAYNAVAGFISNVVTAISNFPGQVKQFISDAISNAAYNVGYFIGLIILHFLNLPHYISDAMSFIWQKIVDTWTNIGNFFTNTIPTLAFNVVSLFWNMVYRVQDAISSLWHNSVNFFRNLVHDVINEAGKLPGQVWDAMRNVGAIAFNIGRDIVMGIVNGMRSLGGWLRDQASNLAHDAWQGAKDALGIASPSKEFAKLGKWSVQGFAEGFDAYDLNSAVAKSVKLPLDSFTRSQQSTSVPGPTSVSVGGAQIVAYLQINDEQLYPVVVSALQDHPQEVALAAQHGDTQLGRRR